MKQSQTKAPHDITCNSQETSNISGTKHVHNKNNSTVFAKGSIIFLMKEWHWSYRNLETIYPKYEKDSRKILTAALSLLDIFIKFLEIYQILA